MTKTTKGTNWEQKFQKPQNENIYLTNLNVENIGNLPILAFRVISQYRVFSIQTCFLFDVLKRVQAELSDRIDCQPDTSNVHKKVKRFIQLEKIF